MLPQKQTIDQTVRCHRSKSIDFSAFPKEFQESYQQRSSAEGVVIRPNARLARLRMCNEHPGRKIDIYCRSHNATVCNECKDEKHQSCFGILPLHQAASGVFKSAEYYDLKRMVDAKIDLLKEEKWKDDSDVHSRAIDQMNIAPPTRKSFTLDRNTPLTIKTKVDTGTIRGKTLERDVEDLKLLICIVENSKSEDDAFILLKSDIKVGQTIPPEVVKSEKSQMKRLSVKQHVTGDAVLSLMRVKRHGDILPSKGQGKRSENKTTVHDVTISKTTTDIITTVLTYVHDIDLGKIKSCSIFGMTVSNKGSLFLCDTNFPRIIVCNEDDKYAYEITLRCEAWDIASIPDNEYFVTSPVFDDHIIQLVDSNRRAVVKVVKHKHVDQGGIAIANDTILVGGKNKVKILDLKGNQIKSMSGIQGKISYIHAGPKRDQILISKSEIYYINDENNVVFSQKLPNDGIPGKPACDIHGNIYVPELLSHKIYRLVNNGKTIEPVLKANNGILFPTAVCFNKTFSKLFVANNSGSSVKVFSLA